MLIEVIKQHCLEAFQAVLPEVALSLQEIAVTITSQVKFGHYQCNSAMKLAKAANQNPRVLAQSVVEKLEKNGQIFEKFEVAGPGFINIWLKAEWLSQYCQKMVGSSYPKKTKKLVIDFSSPNAAKEMHVGHLRSTIIGECLARLFEYLGYPVLRLNHLGDWGTAFGMLIAYLKKEEPLVFNGEKEVNLPLLVHYYKEAKKAFDADLEFKKQSQLAVIELQQGEERSLNAWKMIRQVSLKAYDEIYTLLDINLTERGESFLPPFFRAFNPGFRKKTPYSVIRRGQMFILRRL